MLFAQAELSVVVEVAKQVPSLGVLMFLVVYFLSYISKDRKEQREHEEKMMVRHEALVTKTDLMFSGEAKKLEEVVKDNTKALDRNTHFYGKIEPYLDKLTRPQT